MLVHLLPHLKCVCLLYLLTFVVILPFVSYNLPFSKLYHIFNSREYMKQYADVLNKQRWKTAVKYFNSLNPKESLDFYRNQNRGKSSIIVVIVTVKRRNQNEKLGYFLQTVSAMDRILKSDTNFDTKHLLVCNVDRRPGTHEDVKYVAPYVPTINKVEHSKVYNTTNNRGREEIYNKTMFSGIYEKETVDYLFCLETAYLKNTTYIVVIEDDAYPMKNFLNVVKYSIDTRIHHYHKDFVYIKMYYPQKWQGFGFELTRILDILAIGLVGAGLSVLPYYCLKQRNHKRVVMYFYSVVGAIYFILLALVISRPNVLELRRFSKHFYSFRESPGCCTQAMLYSRTEVPDLINYLIKSQTAAEPLHTDLAIYKYIQDTNKNAFQIEPNLFYHLGMYTSLEGGQKNPEEFIFHV